MILTKACIILKPPMIALIRICLEYLYKYIYICTCIFPPIKFPRQVHGAGVIKGTLGTF